MRALLQSKSTLIVIVSLLAIFVLYQFVFKGEEAPPDVFLTESTFDPADVIIGQELLALLARMRTTRLDTTLFSDPEFSTLEDFSQPIADQPLKRVNPFAPSEPIGGTATTSAGRGTSVPWASFPQVP